MYKLFVLDGATPRLATTMSFRLKKTAIKWAASRNLPHYSVLKFIPGSGPELEAPGVDELPTKTQDWIPKLPDNGGLIHWSRKSSGSQQGVMRVYYDGKLVASVLMVDFECKGSRAALRKHMLRDTGQLLEEFMQNFEDAASAAFKEDERSMLQLFGYEAIYVPEV